MADDHIVRRDLRRLSNARPPRGRVKHGPIPQCVGARAEPGVVYGRLAVHAIRVAVLACMMREASISAMRPPCYTFLEDIDVLGVIH